MGFFLSWGPSATGGLIAKNAKRKAVHISNAVQISGPASRVVGAMAARDANAREREREMMPGEREMGEQDRIGRRRGGDSERPTPRRVFLREKNKQHQKT